MIVRGTFNVIGRDTWLACFNLFFNMSQGNPLFYEDDFANIKLKVFDGVVSSLQSKSVKVAVIQ